MMGILMRIYQFKAKHKDTLMQLLLIIVIPAFISVAFGYEMQATVIKNIPTVVMDQDNSSFSRALINEIKTNEIFNIKYYIEMDEAIEELIAQNKAFVGVIIPADFSKDLVDFNAPKVLIFYDGTKLPIVSAAKARLDEILLTYKVGFMKRVLEGTLSVIPEQSLKLIQPINL